MSNSESTLEKIKYDFINTIIPGGLMGVYNSDGYPFYFISEYMLDYLGYGSEADFIEMIQGRIINAIYPEDREKVYAKTGQCTKYGDEYKVSYRFRKQDGSYIWVSERGRLIAAENGKPAIICICTDITETIILRETLERKKQEYIKDVTEQEKWRRWQLERYRILAERDNTITFDYDPEGDVMNFSIKAAGEPMKELSESQFIRYVTLGKSPLYPRDIENYLKKLQEACSVLQEGHLDYRADNFGTGYRWCRNHYKSVADDQGEIYRVVGMIEDIHDEKQKNMRLKKSAKYDSLMKVLNRESFEFKVKTFLKIENSQAAFFLIDLDDFKLINDTWGHVMGDDVLKHMARCLKKVFKKEGLIARMGGDELAVFMTDNVSAQYALNKGLELQKLFSAGDHRIREVYPSCSIGIAMAPEDGNGFERLYHHADIALYRAKADGKNRCLLFVKDGGGQL